MASDEQRRPQPESREAPDTPPEETRLPSFYDSALSLEELDDLLAHRGAPALEAELDCVRVAVRRILEALQSDAGELTAGQNRLMAQAVFSGVRTIARLLRDRPESTADEDIKVARGIVRSLREMLGERGLDL